MSNIAVILAGGTGKRMGSSVPKQFMDLQGRAVIEYSIETFDRHPAIDEVAVVVHPDWRGKMEEIAAARGWEKLKRIIDGGSERYMSSLNAIMAYINEADDTNLLLHDAARPMVSTEIVDRVVAALRRHEAVGNLVPFKIILNGKQIQPNLLGDDMNRSAGCQSGVHIHHIRVKAVARICRHSACFVELIEAPVPLAEAAQVAVLEHHTLGNAC